MAAKRRSIDFFRILLSLAIVELFLSAILGARIYAFSQTRCEKVAPAGQFETGGRLPVTCPFMTDGLSTLYQDLLGGSYDCVDRIVLNAYSERGMILAGSDCGG